MADGHGFADYLLYVDKQAVAALEAKPAGFPLSGVKPQIDKYSEGLPHNLPAPIRPLPFLYMSTGVATNFVNLLDPEPRSRRVFSFHRPETIAEWMQAHNLPDWIGGWGGTPPALDPKRAVLPSSLRARLSAMPPVAIADLWENKQRALENLEKSLHDDRPRALIQMATGSGKTMLAITSIYRLIKFGGARRILFLVDRSNLGNQAEKEFEGYRTPDDHRKFTELYKVQHLKGNTIGSSTKVVITTIQRLYSMLKGEPDLDPSIEEGSQFALGGLPLSEPVPVAYNSAMPPEFFDIIFIDECHRSIYTLWRQALEYFDAHLIGLTATPAKQTLGFFEQNLVMEYGHERAVEDKVNVPFDVYRIRTEITEKGSKIEAGPEIMVGKRNRQTRQKRWEQPDEDIEYGAKDLDRAVVAEDQIRLIVQTFRDRLPVDIFPGRIKVPKTLIFAKDDSHAEDIVRIFRQEFAKGDDFCMKITYKTTGRDPHDLIRDFRNLYNPRIAVTVDMIATGTDIKPVEIVMFMRTVRSRLLFEQMKGRGVRVIDKTELQAVTPDAIAKTHFVIVDCVGATEAMLSDTQPLERKKTVPFKALLEHVALGGTDPDYYSSLASRLARLNLECGPKESQRIEEASGGVTLGQITKAILTALDPDQQAAEARKKFDLPANVEPTDEQFDAVAPAMLTRAAEPLATRPVLRQVLQDVKRQVEQVIDEISQDELIEAGHSPEAKEKARALVQDFEKFIADNKDEITALQFFYSRPYKERLKFGDIRMLADAIESPPRSWTSERLWNAYATLEKDKVSGASAARQLTDIVSLVRFALHQEDELVPFPDKVKARFSNWVAQQENSGRKFTAEQMRWLEMIRDHVATSVEITPDVFGYTPFAEQGGLGKAVQLFGKDLNPLLNELNEALAA
ncbi:MAG: type I restriction-modification enzyme R subunit C-terminal domain-containing protein [Candidatus Binatus sp.]|uniref:type I restriction endonuclease subunit R n=1 Tax=Candidatus Binatus sp. TaxID=2811406 RepID=UPI00271B3A5C|nr:type I restriction-modification enzyme R subunit C-terminal domain-containing protein [Candidatus Binatus sp.]MDO8433853.1 type I restriction-modification enzyme R subunit C-terminal domain-containing protein [Candidatus Binatus sp.]